VNWVRALAITPERAGEAIQERPIRLANDGGAILANAAAIEEGRIRVFLQQHE